MKKVITKCWIFFMCPFWSLFVNLGYWIIRLSKIGEAREIKKQLSALPLEQAMLNFIWRADNFKDWVPWVITIASKLWTDDCDGAAIMAQWWLKEHGMKSDLVFLYDAKFTTGHCVCVSQDRKRLISNNEVLTLDADNWEANLLALFDGKFTVVIVK